MSLFDIATSFIDGGFSIWSGNRAAHASEDQQKREQAFNAEQAQLNRDWQTAERLAQNEWNLNMWNKNNEYNSLSSQVKRALEAGVNPNLVFGNGAGIASTPAQGAPIGGGAQAQTSSIADTLANAELSKIENAGNTAKKISEIVGQNLQNEFDSKSLDLRIQELSETINNMVAERGLTELQGETIKENLKWIAPIQQVTKDKIVAEAQNFLQDIANKQAELKLTEARERLTNEQVETERLVQDYTLEKTNTEKSLQSKLAIESVSIYKDTLLKQFQLNFQAETGLDPNTSLVPACRKMFGDLSAENMLQTALTLFAVTPFGKGVKGVKGVVKGAKSLFKSAKKFLFGNKPKVGNTITWNF